MLMSAVGAPCDSAPVPCYSAPVPCDSPPAPGTYDMYILRPPKCPRLRGTYDMYILRVRMREVHTAAPKVCPHARACAHTRPRHRWGVGERPHVRGSVERTASLVVAKTSCRGGQARWPWRAEWPLQGIPSKKAASGGCGPISINHVALFGLSCTRFYPAPCFGHIPTRYTLFWPPPYCKLQERVLNAVTAVLSYTIRTYTL